MIIIPKKEIVVPMGRTNIRMKGFLRFQVWRPDNVLNRCRIDTGFFPNTILTSGRNNMNTQANWLSWCHVGTAAVPAPSVTDTQLSGFVVSTNTVVATSDSTQPSAPYFGWKRKTFRFAQGAGHGGENLSEAGVGWGSSGSTLVSRALIVDPDTQVPTTVTPLADEILDVTYELRYYPPLVDDTDSITLNGVNYDTTLRAGEVTGDRWSKDIGTSIQDYSTSGSIFRAYDGVLGTLEQSPSGNFVSHEASGNIYTEAYVNNSHQVVLVCPVGPTGWNLGAGIRSNRIGTTAGYYQCQYSSNPGGNTIPKDNTLIMVMKWILSWAAQNFTYPWNMIAANDVTTPGLGQWNTNLAGTLLRINWEDANTDDQRSELQVRTGSTFRIRDTTDATKFVEYTTTGAYAEQASWTEYAVTQTDIQNGGPTVGNACEIKNLEL